MNRTAALVLAAGRGRRFGGGKMLARLAGRPMLQHVLDLVAAVGLEPVVIVLGSDAAVIERSLAWRSEQRLLNPVPAAGISGSVKLGLSALTDGNAERALVLLGDQPRLTAEQLVPLLAAPADAQRPIVVPRYGGAPGNPVLLERAAWRLAARLTGDRGMSQIVVSQPDLVRYVDMPGTNPGVDTPDELAALSRGAG